MRCYSAAVVGLGNVGLRYDLDAKDGERVTSHTRAYASHPGYRLVGGVDPDEGGRRLFEQRYAAPAFPDIAAMRAAGIQSEVWSIAVPTSFHAKIFEEVIALRPVAILCEKPLADCVTGAEGMVAAAAEQHCTLAVNYMRRFEPGVIALHKLLADGALGEIYKGSGWYCKGLLNNGSHIVDLLAYLLGEATDLQVLAADRSWGGYDPEPDICVTFGRVRVVLLAAREECFSHVGFELAGTGGTVRYTEGGHRIELRRPRADLALPGYRLLDPAAEVLPTDLKRYQWHTVDALHKHLEEGAPLLSSGSSALATLRTIDRVITAMKHLKETA